MQISELLTFSSIIIDFEGFVGAILSLYKSIVLNLTTPQAAPEIIDRYVQFLFFW